MKKNLVSLGLTIVTAAAFALGGCADAPSKAIQADSVVITSVNVAMSTWASYVNAGNATQSQVAAVSNAYSLYYQFQLIASNTAALYAANPSTNAAAAAQLALSATLASESNVINIVQQLTK